MAKSTSISDLPKNESQNEQDIQESMMVNSILKEIENEEEVLNDENEDSMNYVMDTSQIPPKISQEIPTPEMIQAATEDMFQNDNFPMMETNEPEREHVKAKEEIKDLLDPPEEKAGKVTKTGSMLGLGSFHEILQKMKQKVLGPIIILVLYLVWSLKKFNLILLRLVPKLRSKTGEISMVGNLLKGIMLSLVYFVISIFI